MEIGVGEIPPLPWDCCLGWLMRFLFEWGWDIGE